MLFFETSWHAPHLVAAAQIQRDDVREIAAEINALLRDLLPHLGVAPRSDVGVNPDDLQVVLLHDGLHLWHELVPDAERRRRASDVGLARAATSCAGIEAEPTRAARKKLAERLQ